MMFMNVADPRFIHGDYDPVPIKCPTHLPGYVWKISFVFFIVVNPHLHESAFILNVWIRIRVDKNGKKRKPMRIRVTGFSECSLSLYGYRYYY
jgi:hypothetical protein